LFLRTNALATRVLIERGRATGVEFLHRNQKCRARAEREVVLACGTYNTPQLLMLSGVGAASHLSAVGVPTILDRPEVGRNLQDHVNALLGFELSRPVSIQNLLRADRMACSMIRWGLFRNGPLANFPTSAIGFLRTSNAQDRPDISISVTPGGTDHLWFPGIRRPVGHRAFGRITVLHPGSRGEVLLRSASPLEPPRIRMNLLTEPKDLVTLRDGVIAARTIFGEGSMRKLVHREFWPGTGVQTPSAIERWLPYACATAYHGSGTCRMGADPGAVVDHALRVKGIDCLRVADCSVMPNVVGANTNATAMMIAERAAALLCAPG
jgi:choline dehydrogenase-like flavoprotein